MGDAELRWLLENIVMGKKIKILLWWAFATLCLGQAWGCQVDVSGGVGGKLFYPDSIGKMAVSDPRKGMFENGFSESQTLGKETSSGFRGMGGEK